MCFSTYIELPHTFNEHVYGMLAVILYHLSYNEFLQTSIYSVVPTNLIPQGATSSANVMGTGTPFITPYVSRPIHVYEVRISAQRRSLAQPHIHVEAAAFAGCNVNVCFATSVRVVYHLFVFVVVYMMVVAPPVSM